MVAARRAFIAFLTILYHYEFRADVGIEAIQSRLWKLGRQLPSRRYVFTLPSGFPFFSSSTGCGCADGIAVDVPMDGQRGGGDMGGDSGVGGFLREATALRVLNAEVIIDSRLAQRRAILLIANSHERCICMMEWFVKVFNVTLNGAILSLPYQPNIAVGVRGDHMWTTAEYVTRCFCAHVCMYFLCLHVTIRAHEI